MKLKQLLNRIFFFSAIAVLSFTLLAHFAVSHFITQQESLDQKARLRHLVDGLMPPLKDEVIADRVFAIETRGREFFTQHAAAGVEVGIYRADGTPMFETRDSAQLRRILHGEVIADLAYEKREIQFATQTVGYAVFCLRNTAATGLVLRRNLSITLAILLVALLCLFVFVQYSLRRFVVEPANRLVSSIPSIDNCLDPDTCRPKIPLRFRVEELDKVAVALREFIAGFLSAQRNKAQAELLAEKNASMVELATQVSHDIRSPLSVLNVLLETVHDVPEDKRQLLRSATTRINDIANQLLERGKGKGDPEAETVMLGPLLDAIASEKRVHLRKRGGIELDVSLSDGYGLFAAIDRSQLARAVSNLIDNSVEAIASTGHIGVSLRREGDRAVVSVRDDGKGIPANILPRIGERGFSDGKSAGSASGSGLGVFHARRTIELAKGAFAVESTVGEGTCVTFSLPLAEAPRPTAP